MSRRGVEEGHRAAVLLLRDADASHDTAARIGVLDVGGATLEDVTAWSTWQDPEASRREGSIEEEETQGNGGKAYMFRMFRTTARILGVREGRLNCKGFEGQEGSVDRGTPGFIPDIASGRDVPIADLDMELARALHPYGLTGEDLPKEVLNAIRGREAFTLVEGVHPTQFYKGRIDAESLIQKVVRQEQSTLALEQIRLFAIHNGRPLRDGRPLELEFIDPYPELEGPFVHEIPATLPLEGGEQVSTTEGGSKPRGRLVLQTSKQHMYNAYKKLRPRWTISYRTRHQMIGAKPLSDLAPTTPGAAFIYGIVELPALEPGYVDHGRRRPKDGPLVEALDRFIAEKIKELAKEISEQRKRELDDQALDKVQEENKKLDDFKNRFLPSNGAGGGGGETGGEEEGPGGSEPPVTEHGEVPEVIELAWRTSPLRIGNGVELRLDHVLLPRVKDDQGRTVRGVELEWNSSDSYTAHFSEGATLEGRQKGKTDVWAHIPGTDIESQRIPVEVWIVDHVLLTPRNVEIPLGARRQIAAEVTSDDGERSTDVFLQWRHDAEDPLQVRIRPTGWVTGNRLGRTSVTAGAGSPDSGGVWARIPAEVEIVPNPEQPERGSGFPQLLLTGKDIDPATGEVREGDPDSPALWQEPSDFLHNVWWLNLQSPEAAFAFGQYEDDPRVWRSFHVQRVVDMVVQVHMQEEHTKRGEDEQQQFWALHKAAIDRYEVQVLQQMWDELEPYVFAGGGLPS